MGVSDRSSVKAFLGRILLVFVLVGTMNPEEGELRPQLLDRFGLCVEVRGMAEPEARPW